LTPYQRHETKWGRCTRCLLCEQRRRIVLARGRVPCDVLFIGEAPGASEDVLGKPFVGPAGKLLDSIIKDAMPEHLIYALTNLVCCYPREAKSTGENEPPEEAIEACAPRLKEFVYICQPRVIVLVGRLAVKYVPASLLLPRKWAEIIHPAAIIRMDVSQRGLARQRARVSIEDTVEGL